MLEYVLMSCYSRESVILSLVSSSISVHSQEEPGEPKSRGIDIAHPWSSCIYIL
jgi:hypothetical protein